VQQRKNEPQVKAFVEDTITLRGRDLDVLSGVLPHRQLRFFPENPRIYSQVWRSAGEEPTQADIYAVLSKSEHVRDHLVESIRHNGGLMEPVLVRKNVVLEGNSRLAAYRILADQAQTEEDKKRWESIRVRILPDTVTDSEVFSLLGEFHIVGKKDWAPYEQAGYLWRRFTHHSVSEEVLKEELGLSKQRIRHLIHVYGFMIENDERDPARWSYYDELHKIRKFEEARQLYPSFDQVVLEKIRTSEIKRAVDLRDDLPLVVAAGNKILKKFMDGRLDFDSAVIEARAKGAGNATMKRLEDSRRWLADDEREEDIQSASPDERSGIKFNLTKLRDRADQLLRRHFRQSS
jgi:hypothetical protein